MGDAAGQLANRFEALHAAEPVFGFKLVRDFGADTFFERRRQLAKFAQQPAAVRHIPGFNENAVDLAAAIARRLVDKVDHLGLGCSVHDQLDFCFRTDIGLTRLVDLVQQLNKALRGHFRKHVRHRPSEHGLALANQLKIGRIGNFEDVRWSAQDGDGARRLRKQVSHPVHFCGPLARRQNPVGRFVPLIEDADDFAVAVNDRAERVIPVGFFGKSIALDGQHLVKTGDGFALRQHPLELRTYNVPDVCPELICLLPERFWMAVSGHGGPGIIVEQVKVRPPVNGGRHIGVDAKAKRDLERGGPLIHVPQRMRRPVERPYTFGHLAVSHEPGAGPGGHAITQVQALWNLGRVRTKHLVRLGFKPQSNMR